jgi:hypothetical protein
MPKVFFGILLGYVKENNPILKKSYGQIWINEEDYHYFKG